MLRRIFLALPCLAVILGITTQTFAAAEYGFENITNNSGINVATQLKVTVQGTADDAAITATQVRFVFTNGGPLASSITDIYFDDGTLLGIANITDSGAGVDFAQGASPGDLPGGNAVGFETTAGFSADSEPPTQPNGVNPGESVSILFNLINGKTYADTILALNGGVDLRIGLHVQGLSNGSSDAFVNTGNPVPLPAAAWMGMGLLGSVGGVGAFRRRRKSEIA